MKRFASMRGLTVLIAATRLAAANEPSTEPSVAEIYAASCAACHGTRLQGGQGPSLLSSTYVHGIEDEQVARSIRDGFPAKGMPPWHSLLSDEQIANLVRHLRDERARNSPEYLAALDRAQESAIPTRILHSELESFRIELIAEPAKPWGMAFLPDGRLLVTEQQGRLRIIDHGRLLAKPVDGTPRGHPTDPFKRVLLDVRVHPDYVRNGWIYLTCADSSPSPSGSFLNEVSLIRGRLRNNAWIDSQVLAHFAIESTATARLVFDSARYLYLSTSSEAGINEARGTAPFTLKELLSSAPQDLKDPQGKILRLRDDGTVPVDNPFVHTTGALGAIWSYGHRNPQGLAIDPLTGWLWSAEQGPRGGDELNWIRPGHNYGWPVISYGTRYDGFAFTTEVERQGMDQPVINWTPDIAVSSIAFYEGNAFPKWKHSLFVGSLIAQKLLRVVLDRDQALVQELILRDVGRIRDIAVGPEGDLYLATELKAQGLVLRLVPAS
jgi:aldose sugar dehydrogenase